MEYWKSSLYSMMRHQMGDTQRAQEKCEELSESMSENVAAVGLKPHKDLVDSGWTTNHFGKECKIQSFVHMVAR